MNTLRKAHLYLGCFFAPMLLYFATSGLWQIIGLHRSSPALRVLSSVHMALMQTKGGKALLLTSIPLTVFCMLMSLAFITTIILGIVLAFRYGRKWTTASLLAGMLLPLALILIFAHRG